MTKRTVTILAAMCLFGAGGATALASLSSSVHKSQLAKHFAVLLHHSAVKASAGIPSSAVLATKEDGTTVFANTRSSQNGTKLCVIYSRSGEVAEACGSEASAEREGVDVIDMTGGSASTVVVLVPNGVSAVSFTGRDGVVANVPVTNNVAMLQQAPIASFHYTVPGGASRTANIPGS